MIFRSLWGQRGVFQSWLTSMVPQPMREKRKNPPGPSLQDLEYGGSCPVVFVGVGCVSHIADGGPYIVANNPGSAPSSTAGRLSGYPGSPDLFHLLALPTSFPNTLAILFVTISVIRDMRVWKKKTSTVRIGTSDLLVHGSPPVETINLWEVLYP